MDLEQLKYPIGHFLMPTIFDRDLKNQWILEIETLPHDLKLAIENVTSTQLNQVYRPDGWTLRQVIHHLADSHMNAYIRFKLALTEEMPIIRPYHEDLWAETEEAKYGSVLMSVALLTSLHQRWVAFLKTLKLEDYQRKYIHPEHGKKITLANMLGTYAWHGQHHLAQITKTLSK